MAVGGMSLGAVRQSLRIRKLRILAERRARIKDAQHARRIAQEEQLKAYYAPGNPGFEKWKAEFEKDFCL
jgi:hypothetical protein